MNTAKAALGENKQQLLDLAAAENLIISSPALALLEKAELSAALRVLKDLAEKNAFIINEVEVEARLSRTKLNPETESVTVLQTRFKPAAKEYSPHVRELKNLNFSSDRVCEGSLSDFVKLFSDKFSFLESVLKQRSGFSPKSIAQCLSNASPREITFCAMVQEKWVSKNGHLAFRLEDMESECIAIVLKTDAKMMSDGGKIMPDEVIGIRGKKGNGGLVIITEIIQPDMPLRAPEKSDSPLSVAVISDLHLGSKLFLEKELNKFLDWLTGKSDSVSEREKSGRIKYLVVAGDTVDGIGVYPGQITKLTIKDIFKQYEALEDILLRIPEYIEVFVIPGQHDAVRWADPQPAIPKQYVPRLSELSNFHLLPSPGWVEIEGLKTLLYHGAALHELYHFIPELSMTKPEKAMIEVLKRRSFLLNYGNKQPYAPENRDYLLISEPPDLYFGGDMHHIGLETYRGCSVVNSSCFQERTEYEIKLGHVPTPALVPVVELDSRNMWVKDFSGKGAEDS